MKKSELLRLALDNHLWGGYGRPPCGYTSSKSKYLCVAIEEAARAHVRAGVYNASLAYDASGELRNHIADCLGEDDCGNYYETVTDWLQNEVGIPSADLRPTQVQAYRRRWGEHLIEQYQRKGE